MFPLIASPFAAVAAAAGFSAVTGFAVLNIALLAWAFHRAVMRFGAWAAALVFVSPLLWWIDKAQVEVFTVSLLALAMTFAGQLSLAALCCAVAAAQNPPFVLGSAYAALRATRSAPDVRGPRWAWWVTAVVALLHPLYYIVTLGRATPLLTGGLLIPAPKLLLLPLLDLNMGLAWTAPVFAGAVVLAAVVAARPARGALVAAFAGGGLVLLAAAQATNLNSAGTPSVNRYALWIFPLALPLAAAARHSRAVKVFIAGSMAASVLAFRPALAESSLTPSSLALFVWTHHPTWDNPPPEIFAERMRHQDGANTLASTPGCEKVLVSGGEWPTGCEALAPMPDRCRDAICYVNRRPDGTYTFVPVARRPGHRLR